MLVQLMAAVAAIPAPTTEVRDAPWRLTGISKDTRTLKVVYEGGGCLRPDGRAVVDTTQEDAVRITVKQTAVVGAPCTTEYAFLPLDVRLGAPLAGRRVRGGPPMTATNLARVIPRVVGLRRVDAVAALAGQGIEADVGGRRSGVIRRQSPRAGQAPGSRMKLASGAFDARARLSIRLLRGQTVESVLRRGLRFRYRVDPAAEAFIAADVACAGPQGGFDEATTEAPSARMSVAISGGDLRRRMRRRARSTCRLRVVSYPADPRGEDDFLLLRRATVILRHR